MRKIGKPTTVLELKIMLDLYPNDSKLNFRNQPTQTLYETKDDNGEFILFFQVEDESKH